MIDTSTNLGFFFASTFPHDTALEEAIFAFGSDGFEEGLDGDEGLFACLDGATEISPHLDEG